ncbi:DER1-domain-containing protein [Clavulina sp. PMI_390]|nr:DER1-domain-containing protein [Clavulina sp. PMI_390]
MSELWTELKKIPPVTRFVLFSLFGVTVPTTILEVVSPYPFFFTYDLGIKQFQIWRIFTSFFLVLLPPGQKLQFIFDVAMLYRASNHLEEGKYPQRSADYAWHLLLTALSCFALNVPLKAFVHFRPLLLAMVTVSSLIDPEAPTSLFGLISFPQKYYPLVLLGLETLNGGVGGAVVATTGLISGYGWWMLEWKEGPGSPNPGSGRVMGRAPNWLRRLIGDQATPVVPRSGGVDVRVPAGRALNDGGRGQAPIATGYNWGSGQRLGSS